MCFSEREIYNKHMTSLCVRLYMEGLEKQLQGFIQEFQKLTVADEKTDLLERFLTFVYNRMNTEPIWQGMASLWIFPFWSYSDQIIPFRIQTIDTN